MRNGIVMAMVLGVGTVAQAAVVDYVDPFIDPCGGEYVIGAPQLSRVMTSFGR